MFFLIHAKNRMMSFWLRHPALLLGLGVTLSTYAFLTSVWAWIVVILLFLTSTLKQHILLTICLLGQGVWVHFHYAFSKPAEIEKALFYVENVTASKYGGWTYRGVLNTQEDKVPIKNAPCKTFSKNYYTPFAIYEVVPSKLKLSNKLYQFKTKLPWLLVNEKKSLERIRKKGKESVSNYLQNVIPEERARQFLTGLCIGSIPDRVLWKEFNNLGLSHLLAISGFHFSLLVAFFHFFLRIGLSPKGCALSLIVLVTGYFIFIGVTPSIERAWISVFLFYIGQLIQRQTSALNNLGVALLISSVTNPLSTLSLGFQLSFLATAGILLFFRPLSDFFSFVFFSEPLEVVKQKGLLNQISRVIFNGFKDALALNTAVNMVIFPLLLYHFHAFPLHSFFYNLFFPFLASLSLLLVCVGTCLHGLISPLGLMVHKTNSSYTDFLLSMCDFPPTSSKTLYIETMSCGQLTAALVVLFLSGILIYQRKIKLLD